MKKVIFGIVSCVAVVGLVVGVVSTHYSITEVRGSSMEPGMKAGNLAVVKKCTVRQGDIVVFRNAGHLSVKRVIGVEGDTVESRHSSIYVNGKRLAEDYAVGRTDSVWSEVGKDEFFVLGDNRENSLDSRILGCVKEKNVVGKVVKVLGH